MPCDSIVSESLKINLPILLKARSQKNISYLYTVSEEDYFKKPVIKIDLGMTQTALELFTSTNGALWQPLGIFIIIPISESNASVSLFHTKWELYRWTGWKYSISPCVLNTGYDWMHVEVVLITAIVLQVSWRESQIIKWIIMRSIICLFRFQSLPLIWHWKGSLVAFSLEC